MRFKNKKHIVIPVAIVIYTIVIATYFGLKSYTTEMKGTFILVIGVNLALAAILYFILKKRDDLRNK